MQQYIDEFAEPEFIQANKSFYDRYIEYRIHGYTPRTSFMRTFGPEHWRDAQVGSVSRVESIEATAYYQSKFESRLKEITVDKLWHTKLSIHELLTSVRDPLGSSNARLNAIKELNVLVGITVIDENGKTKAGRNLSDFYKDVEQGAASTAKPAQDSPKE